MSGTKRFILQVALAISIITLIVAINSTLKSIDYPTITQEAYAAESPGNSVIITRYYDKTTWTVCYTALMPDGTFEFECSHTSRWPAWAK